MSTLVGTGTMVGSGTMVALPNIPKMQLVLADQRSFLIVPNLALGIGRVKGGGGGRTNEVLIELPYISSNHAEITGSDEVSLTDSSSNGTLLNGVLLTKGQPTLVNIGDTIQFAPNHGGPVGTFEAFTPKAKAPPPTTPAPVQAPPPTTPAPVQAPAPTTPVPVQAPAPTTPAPVQAPAPTTAPVQAPAPTTPAPVRAPAPRTPAPTPALTTPAPNPAPAAAPAAAGALPQRATPLLPASRKQSARPSNSHLEGNDPDEEPKELPLDVDLIVDLIKQHQQGSANTTDQDLVLLLGKSGVGKSTTLNWLMGRAPEWVTVGESYMKNGVTREAKKEFMVKDPLKGFAVSSEVKSCTLFLNSYKIPNLPSGREVYFCDSPGTDDTSGTDTDIANAVAIAAAMKKCKSVRPLILIGEGMLTAAGRCVELMNFLRQVAAMLTQPAESVSSIAVLFTRCGQHTTVGDLLDVLEQLEKSTQAEETEHGVMLIKLLIAELETHKELLIMREGIDIAACLKVILEPSRFITKPAAAFCPLLGAREKTMLEFACQSLQMTIGSVLQSGNVHEVTKPLEQLFLLSDTSRLYTAIQSYQLTVQEVCQTLRMYMSSAQNGFERETYPMSMDHFNRAWVFLKSLKEHTDRQDKELYQDGEAFIEFVSEQAISKSNKTRGIFKKPFSCFLSHNWGNDESGKDTHGRVGEINVALKDRGYSTWFDEEKMEGDVNLRMTEGIEGSEVVVVFITERYISKCASAADDNCKKELQYAVRTLTTQRIIPVILEESARDQKKWKGTLGLELGQLLYIDMSADEIDVSSLCDSLGKKNVYPRKACKDVGQFIGDILKMRKLVDAFEAILSKEAFTKYNLTLSYARQEMLQLHNAVLQKLESKHDFEGEGEGSTSLVRDLESLGVAFKGLDQQESRAENDPEDPLAVLRRDVGTWLKDDTEQLQAVCQTLWTDMEASIDEPRTCLRHTAASLVPAQNALAALRCVSQPPLLQRVNEATSRLYEASVLMIRQKAQIFAQAVDDALSEWNFAGVLTALSKLEFLGGVCNGLPATRAEAEHVTELALGKTANVIDRLELDVAQKLPDSSSAIDKATLAHVLPLLLRLQEAASILPNVPGIGALSSIVQNWEHKFDSLQKDLARRAQDGLALFIEGDLDKLHVLLQRPNPLGGPSCAAPATPGEDVGPSSQPAAASKTAEGEAEPETLIAKLTATFASMDVLWEQASVLNGIGGKFDTIRRTFGAELKETVNALCEQSRVSSASCDLVDQTEQCFKSFDAVLAVLSANSAGSLAQVDLSQASPGERRIPDSEGQASNSEDTSAEGQPGGQSSGSGETNAEGQPGGQPSGEAQTEGQSTKLLTGLVSSIQESQRESVAAVRLNANTIGQEAVALVSSSSYGDPQLRAALSSLQLLCSLDSWVDGVCTRAYEAALSAVRVILESVRSELATIEITEELSTAQVIAASEALAPLMKTTAAMMTLQEFLPEISELEIAMVAVNRSLRLSTAVALDLVQKEKWSELAPCLRDQKALLEEGGNESKGFDQVISILTSKLQSSMAKLIRRCKQAQQAASRNLRNMILQKVVLKKRGACTVEGLMLMMSAFERFETSAALTDFVPAIQELRIAVTTAVTSLAMFFYKQADQQQQKWRFFKLENTLRLMAALGSGPKLAELVAQQTKEIKQACSKRLAQAFKPLKRANPSNVQTPKLASQLVHSSFDICSFERARYPPLEDPPLEESRYDGTFVAARVFVGDAMWIDLAQDGLRESRDCKLLPNYDFGDLHAVFCRWLHDAVDEICIQVESSVASGMVEEAQSAVELLHKLEASSYMHSHFSSRTSSLDHLLQTKQRNLSNLELVCLHPQDHLATLNALKSHPEQYEAHVERVTEKLTKKLDQFRETLHSSFKSRDTTSINQEMQSLADMFPVLEAFQGHDAAQSILVGLTNVLRLAADAWGEEGTKARKLREAHDLVPLGKSLRFSYEIHASFQHPAFASCQLPLIKATLESLDELSGYQTSTLEDLMTKHSELVSEFSLISKSVNTNRIADLIRQLGNFKSLPEWDLEQTTGALKKVMRNTNFQELFKAARETWLTRRDRAAFEGIATALDNLSALGDIPELGAMEVRNGGTNVLVNQIEQLVRSMVESFEIAFKGSITDTQDADVVDYSNNYADANDGLETLVLLSDTLKKYPEICKGCVNSVTQKLTTAAKDLSMEVHDVKDLDGIAQHLCKIFEISSKISQELVRKAVHRVVQGKLVQLATDGCDFGGLGMQLCKSEIGQEIVADFSQFKAAKMGMFNKATAGVNFESALNELKRLNPDLSTTEGKKLTEAYHEFEAEHKRLREQFYYTPKDLFPEVIANAKQGVSGVKVLSGVLAAWTLENSLDDREEVDQTTEEEKLEGDAGSMMMPHCTQVITLLRLLHLDQEVSFFSGSAKIINSASKAVGNVVGNVFKKGIGLFKGGNEKKEEKSEQEESEHGDVNEERSHLVQVGTGQGKSVILGVLSIMLALKGFQVDIACYSPILSERDAKDFKFLIEKFGVSRLVTYGTFDDLVYTCIKAGGDVGVGAQAVFERRFNSTTVQMGALPPRVLLIDEVDVFFAENFYGTTFNMGRSFRGKEITDVMQYVFDNRKREKPLTVSEVKAKPVYQTLMEKSHLAPYIMELKLLMMINHSRLVEHHKYIYDEVTKRIGYKDTFTGTISYTTFYGNLTAFAYFLEMAKGKLSAETLVERVACMIIAGNYSYAECPHVYKRVMGVTGTLDILGKFERDVMENTYKIKKSTIMPSMFGKSLMVDEDIVVESDREEYYKIIQTKIAVSVNRNRAVLVFFDTEKDMDDWFDKCGKQVSSGNKKPLLVRAGEKNLASIVSRATQSQQVTLFPRAYGRGLDFWVRDQKVIEGKGMHKGVQVIQTFLSSERSEQVQIRGRTARQDKPGSYAQVLCSQDLLKKGEFALEQGKVDQLEKWYKDGKQKELREGLTRIQVARGEARMQARASLVTAAKKAHDITIEFQTQLREGGEADSKQLEWLLLNLQRTPSEDYKHPPEAKPKAGTSKKKKKAKLEAGISLT